MIPQRILEPPAIATRRFEATSMASPLRLTVVIDADASVDPDDLAEAAWTVVLDEFDACEQALSRFLPGSDATRLNRQIGPDPVVVTDRLYRALSIARRAWRVTGGLFDPRVLETLDRLGYRGAPLDRPAVRVLSPDEDWIELDPAARRAAVLEPVDFGGVGKGLALRWAARRVERILGVAEEVSGFLLEAGGDIVLRAPSPDGGQWVVGIENPMVDAATGSTPVPAHLAMAALWDGAICTSSSGYIRWRDGSGVLRHHLIDPRTGHPGGDGLVSVTVAGADPAWAEIWSKSLLLSGPGRIGPLAREHGLAAWWVGEDGSMSMTPAARQRTVWTADR